MNVLGSAPKEKPRAHAAELGGGGNSSPLDLFDPMRPGENSTCPAVQRAVEIMKRRGGKGGYNDEWVKVSKI